MSQKPSPRDPHPDNQLIDSMESEPGAQGSRSGGRVAQEIASRDEEKSAFGADPSPTRATKGDKVQPDIPTRSDHEAARTFSGGAPGGTSGTGGTNHEQDK